MRIAVAVSSPLVTRAARMVLAEPDLDQLGLLGRTPSATDSRVRRIDDLTGYDVVMSDEADAAAAGTVRRAAAAGVSCVLWAETDVAWEGPGTLVAGANLGSGIAPALASHQAAMSPSGDPVTIAWTEPGRPLRSGVAVPFPDPVGSLWAEERSDGAGTRRLAAPVGGEWAGALVMVGPPRHPSRVVGVADDARHLEAMALAATAVTAARGRYPGGVVPVAAAAEDFLLAAISMGLEVAGLAAG